MDYGGDHNQTESLAWVQNALEDLMVVVVVV